MYIIRHPRAVGNYAGFLPYSIQLESMKSYVTAAWRMGSIYDYAGDNDLANDGVDFVGGGIAGGCGQFIAANTDELYIASMDDDLKPTGSMGISLWVKLTSQPAEGGTFCFFAAENASYYNYHIQYSTISGAGRLYWQVRQSNGSDKAVTASSQTLTTGVWFHLFCVAINSNLYLYKNAISVGSTGFDNTIEADPGAFRMGNRKGGDWSDMYMDEVYLFKDLATGDPEGVAEELYNGGLCRYWNRI